MKYVQDYMNQKEKIETPSKNIFQAELELIAVIVIIAMLSYAGFELGRDHESIAIADSCNMNRSFHIERNKEVVVYSCSYLGKDYTDN